MLQWPWMILDEIGTILSLNHAAAAWLGQPYRRCLQASLPTLLPSAAWAKLEPHYLVALQEAQVGYGQFPESTAGACLHFSLSPDPVSATFTLLVYSPDPSSALPRQADFFRQLVELSPDYLYTIEADGTFSYVSPNWVRGLGYAADEVIGKKFMDLIHPEDLPRCLAFLAKGLEQGQINEEIEYRVKHQEGHYVWNASKGTLWVEDGQVRYLGNARDITSRKVQELELQEIRHRLSLAADAAKMGIWDYDLSDHSLVWDQRMYEVFQVDPADFEGVYAAWSSRVHPEDLPAAVEALQAAIRQEKEFDTVFRIVCKNGSIRYIKGDARLLLDGAGQPKRVIGVNYDITAQKEAEVALHESKRILQDVFNFSPIPMIITREADGAILMVNEGAEKLLGHPVRNLLDAHLPHFYHQPELRQNLLLLLQNKGQVKNEELVIQQPDGQLVPCLVSIGRIAMQGEAMLIKGFVDISERKKFELALQESEERFKKLIYDLNIGVVVQDADAQITLCNQAALDLLGLSADQLLGKTSFDPYWQVIHEDGSDFPGSTHPVPVAIQTLLPVKNVIMGVYRPASEDWVWILVNALPLLDEAGRLIHVIATFLDITERRLFEQALQVSENRLNTVFENTDIAYVLFDAEFKILSFNHPAQEFSQREHSFPLEEGRSAFDYYPATTNPELYTTFSKLQAGKKVEFEREVTNAQGETYWYRVSYSSVFDQEQRFQNLLLVIEDITTAKKSQIELFQSFELVSEQNKRLLNFSYIVSHNLRSHASNVKTIIDFIETATSEAEREAMLANLKTVIYRLDDTLYNLNEVVSIQRNVNLLVEPLNLHQYIEQAIGLLADQINSKLGQVINDVPTNTIIHFNPAYLESILVNFLSNAIKYAHPQLPPLVRFSIVRASDRMILSIQDNGLGIDLKKYGEKLFGMYKTFHGNKDAKGIGLFIAKNQIEALGGRVEVESTVGVGTTFHIAFKVEEE